MIVATPKEEEEEEEEESLAGRAHLAGNARDCAEKHPPGVNVFPPLPLGWALRPVVTNQQTSA